MYNINPKSFIMKKLISFISGLIAMLALALTPTIPTASADTYINQDYTYYPDYNQQFHPSHPDYYDGNLRVKLKNKADIERATKSNLHYDKSSGDYYTCNWKYNDNLGTWVCNKSKAGSSVKKVQACPFGYKISSSAKYCERVRVPSYARLNSTGDGFVCNAGYQLNYLKNGCVKYTKTNYVYLASSNLPAHLPSTGPGALLALIGSSLGGYWFVRRKSDK